MKILHVTPYCYPAYAYGGPPKAVYELAKRQVQAGHTVTVLTTTAYEKNKVLPVGATIVDGIRIVRLPNVTNWLMWQYHFSTPIGVGSFLNNDNFDVIHLHEVRTLLNLLALFKLPASARIIISPWGTLPHSNNLVWFKKVFDYFLLPLARKKIKVGLAQTAHELSLIKKWRIARKSVLVPLAISVSEFASIPTKAAARNALGIHKNDFLYLFLGRFSPFKGLDLIINSFEKVARLAPNARLLLVGRDDNYRSQLQSLIDKAITKERIIIHDPLYGSDRLKAYAAADVLVFAPSVYEETGTVCLEALATGTPVITTKQAEIPLLTVTDGVIHSRRRMDQLTKHMRAMYNKKYTVNLKKVTRFFDWNSVAETIITIYNS